MYECRNGKVRAVMRSAAQEEEEEKKCGVGLGGTAGWELANDQTGG